MIPAACCLQSVRTYKLRSYLTVNTSLYHYKDQPVNAVEGIIAVYCDKHTKYLSTLSGQSPEFLKAARLRTLLQQQRVQSHDAYKG